MRHKPLKGEGRTAEQLRNDYEIEKELASRLRSASRQERRLLYSSLYNEMYERTPLHPQLIRKSSPELIAEAVFAQIKFLNRFLNKEATFLEVGPGDCTLSIEVTKHVKQVFAIDVSTEITKGLLLPSNFNLVISDGSSIPVPDNSINIAYSNQLMEHLHPEDAFEQLQNIYSSLSPGGVYICITPNRLSGPHDISKYFDSVATGFHLKEYTISELVKLFQAVGFSSCNTYIGARGIYIQIPLILSQLFEAFSNMLPYSLMSIIMRSPLRVLLGIRLVGRK